MLQLDITSGGDAGRYQVHALSETMSTETLAKILFLSPTNETYHRVSRSDIQRNP
jgi:hypothetical protein